MKIGWYRGAVVFVAFGMTACRGGAQYPPAPEPAAAIDATIPFSFDISAERLRAQCQAEIAEYSRRMDAVANLPAAKAKFANVVREMELIGNETSHRTTPLTFLKYVAPAEDVRAAAGECEIAVGQASVEMSGREDLYRAAKAAAAKKEKLDAQDAQLLQGTLIRFKNSGLELPPEQRRVFTENEKTLVQLESQFQTNLDEWKDELLVTRKELAGLPKDYLESLQRTCDGRYRITLDYPHYFPFMKQAKDAEARKKLEYKFNRRGGIENVRLLERALRLRHENAKMLGYQNHAQFVLSRLMAKKQENVAGFLGDLTRALRPRGEADLAEMLAVKQQEQGNQKATRIEAWDWRYYGNQLLGSKYDLDPQKLKEWFPLDVVVRGMFSIYETLLGVQFVPAEGPTWHPDVQFFRVMQNGETRAYFYADLFPRAGKFGHAASFTLIGGMQQRNGAYRAPIAAIVANFSAPAQGRQPRLTHDEVATLFHEFGHVMHETLTTARYRSYSGTNVKMDFVEMPSEVFSFWVWQPETLKMMSGHYRTGKPLPPEMLDQIAASRLHHVGIRYLRTVALSRIDQAYHSSPTVDTQDVYAQLMHDIMGVPTQEGTYPQANFGHLMGGYDATYYAYLWSESIAADLFQRFRREGLLNCETGGDFRRWILEPGGTREPDQLVKGFLGRERDPRALWEVLGLQGGSVVK